jgi:hypothetical protein
MLNHIETTSLVRRKIILFIALIVILIMILEIWAVNRLATYGDKISKLEQAKNALVLDNQILTRQIAQEASLKTVDQEAKVLGFDRTRKLEYLQDSGLALNH